MVMMTITYRDEEGDEHDNKIRPGLPIGLKEWHHLNEIEQSE